MAGQNFSPGDVTINSFIIGGTDVSRRLMEFKIFENIKNPYTILTATILDVANILNQLNGAEACSISVSPVGGPAYSGSFLVMAVESSIQLENQRAAIYNITAYSPQMVRLPIVIKSFKNITGTAAITQLVNQYIQPPKPFVAQSQSQNQLGTDQQPYIINGIQIYQAIKSIMTRSQASNDPASAWMFFENQHNLILDTMGHLISSASAGSTSTFYQRPLGMNFLKDQALQQFDILAMEEKSRVNTVDQVQGTNQTVDTFDVLTNIFKSTNFSQAGSGGIQASAASIRNFLPMNGMGADTGAENFVAPRKLAAGTYDSQSITVHVAYNPTITVGLGAAIKTLVAAGDTITPVPDGLAGTGVVTEVCHAVNFLSEKMQGTTTLTLLKSGSADD